MHFWILITNYLRLSRVSNMFYSLIPHSGSTPPIKTIEQIKSKSVMLEALTDIEIAHRLMKQKVRLAAVRVSYPRRELREI